MSMRQGVDFQWHFLDCLLKKIHKNFLEKNEFLQESFSPYKQEKYYIPKQWMYGQIIGKKGRTLEHIKDRSGLHHIYMDINNGSVFIILQS